MIKTSVLIALFLFSAVTYSVAGIDVEQKRYKLIVVIRCNVLQLVIYRKGFKTKLLMRQHLTRDTATEIKNLLANKKRSLKIFLRCPKPKELLI